LLTQIAVTQYKKKITEENNSINLDIRTVCAAVCLGKFKTQQKFEDLGVGRSKRKLPTNTEIYKRYITLNEQHSN
jgi:hypothetical protein